MNTNEKIVVAIVGMCGSGKSVATEFFVKNGFNKIYFGAVTLEAITAQRLEITPDNERSVREALREKDGLAAYAKYLLPRIIENSSKGDVVLDGLYSWSEYKYLMKNLDSRLIVVAVISDKQIRFERLSQRDFRPLSKEDAEKRDYSEIEKLEKGGPIAEADYYIINNSTMDSFISQLTEILAKIRANN